MTSTETRKAMWTGSFWPGKGKVSCDAQLGTYYLDFSPTAEFIEQGGYGAFDSDSVPLVDYDRLFPSAGTTKGRQIFGQHYTPVTIAQYGLGNLNRYQRTQNEQFLNFFLKQAEWLLTNLRSHDGVPTIWVHDFQFPSLNLTPPWASAMAQGEGISVLLRAYQITQNHSFLDAAWRAFDAFNVSIVEGGVCVREKDELWLEEYPTSPPCHVLNGFIYALLGVFDLYRVTMDANVHAVWVNGLRTLVRNLHRYDLGFWSCYDLWRHPIASPGYHSLHVLQLTVLAEITGERVFSKYAQRWQCYADSRICRALIPIVGRGRGALRRSGLFSPLKIKGIQLPALQST